MKGMYGNKDHVVIPVHQLDYLMHPSLIILHSYKTAEYTHTIIDMDDVIPYRERCKVIYGQLLALLHASSYGDPVETVEDLMVTVAADLVFMVNESVMKVFLRNEFRHDAPVLGHYGLKPVQLGLLLSIYPYPVTFLQTLSYIFRQKLEVLVERRLRGDAELYGFLILTRQRKLHVYFPESLKPAEEIPVLVHIGRIQPHDSIRRKRIGDIHHAPLLFRGHNVRIYLSLSHFLL